MKDYIRDFDNSQVYCILFVANTKDPKSLSDGKVYVYNDQRLNVCLPKRKSYYITYIGKSLTKKFISDVCIGESLLQYILQGMFNNRCAEKILYNGDAIYTREWRKNIYNGRFYNDR